MPIAGVVRTPFVMEVNNDLPVKTVPEFIAYAKANPGKINFATVGPGSAQHLYGEYFKMLTGIAMVPVHYHGAAPALTDLIAGRVQVMFDVVVSSLVLHQIRPGPRAGGDHGGAGGRAAGRADSRPIRAGL